MVGISLINKIPMVPTALQGWEMVVPGAVLDQASPQMMSSSLGQKAAYHAHETESAYSNRRFFKVNIHANFKQPMPIPQQTIIALHHTHLNKNKPVKHFQSVCITLCHST